MKTKKKINILQVLKDTGRNLYITDEVAENAPAEPTGDIELFQIGKYITCRELEAEYATRDLVPATLQSLIDFDGKSREVLDEKKYVATQWKDKDGKYCYATFSRWHDGERYVLVARSDGGWLDDWWFAGVRKSSALGTSDTQTSLEPLDLALESAIKIVKEAGYKVIKEL